MFGRRNDRFVSDPDRTDPERAVVSPQEVVATWLLVLLLAITAVLPSVLSLAQA